MDINANRTMLQSSSLNQAEEEHAAAAAHEAAQLEAEAIDNALWHMATKNAVTEMEGSNNRAKSANEIS